MCLTTTFLDTVLSQVHKLEKGKITPEEFEQYAAQVPPKLIEELQKSAHLGKDVSFLIQGSMNFQKPSVPPTKIVQKLSTKIIKNVVSFTEQKLLNRKEVISHKSKQEIAKTIQLVLPNATPKIHKQLVRLDHSLKIERNLKELKRGLTAKKTAGLTLPCEMGCRLPIHTQHSLQRAGCW